MGIKNVIILDDNDKKIIDTIYEEFNNAPMARMMRFEDDVFDKVLDMINLILDSKDERSNIEIDAPRKVQSKIEYIYLNRMWFFIYLDLSNFYDIYQGDGFSEGLLEKRWQYRRVYRQWMGDVKVIIKRPYGLIEEKLKYRNGFGIGGWDAAGLARQIRFDNNPESFEIPKLLINLNQEELTTIKNLSAAQIAFMDNPCEKNNNNLVFALTDKKIPELMETMLMYEETPDAVYIDNSIMMGRFDRKNLEYYRLVRPNLYFLYFKLLMEIQKDNYLREYGLEEELYKAAMNCEFWDKDEVSYTRMYPLRRLRGGSNRNFVLLTSNVNPISNERKEVTKIFHSFYYREPENWLIKYTRLKGLDIGCLKR